MARHHHYRRRGREPVDLDMTTFLNLMVVLVPFLLITAVFSRITIVELNLPSSAGGSAALDPPFRVEVVVREQGLEITNGRVVIASIPKLEDAYDLEKLSELMVSLKRDNPDSDNASVLLEPEIEYEHLIRVMDVVRSADLPRSERADDDEAAGAVAEAVGEESFERVALFTHISIGDAP